MPKNRYIQDPRTGHMLGSTGTTTAAASIADNKDATAAKYRKAHEHALRKYDRQTAAIDERQAQNTPAKRALRWAKSDTGLTVGTAATTAAAASTAAAGTVGYAGAYAAAALAFAGALAYRGVKSGVDRAARLAVMLTVAVALVGLISAEAAHADTNPSAPVKTVTQNADGTYRTTFTCADGTVLRGNDQYGAAQCAPGAAEAGHPQVAYCTPDGSSYDQADNTFMTDSASGLQCGQAKANIDTGLVPVVQDPYVPVDGADPVPAKQPEALTDKGPKTAKPDVRVRKTAHGYRQVVDCAETGQLDAGVRVTTKGASCVRDGAEHGLPQSVESTTVKTRKVAKGLRLRKQHGKATFVKTAK